MRNAHSEVTCYLNRRLTNAIYINQFINLNENL